MQIIPFKPQAAWQNQITLTNVIYIFYFRWNALNQYWVMNIYNRNDEPVVLGIKVVPNYNLTESFVAAGMPSGEILCQNIINEWNSIKRFDMGETCELIYYESGEIESLVV